MMIIPPRFIQSAYVLLSLTFCFLSACDSNKARTGDISVYRANVERTGVYETRGVHNLGVVKWRFETGGWIDSAPIVSHGIVYFGSDDGFFYAVDAASGDKKWSFKTDGIIESAAFYSEGKVYFGGFNGYLYALDAESGQLGWKFHTAGRISSSPLVIEGLVLFGSGDGNFYALDAVTGDEKWRFETGGGWLDSAPAIKNGIVFFGDNLGKLYSVDIRTGLEKWRFKTEDGGALSAIIYGKKSCFAVGGGPVYVLDIATGRQKTKIYPGTYNSSVSVANETLYYNDNDGFVLAKKIEQEGTAWSYKMEGRLSSPAVADGILYIGSEDGFLNAIDAKTGRKKWRFKVGASVLSAPAIADGTIYFGSRDGHLYALQEPTHLTQPQVKAESFSD